MKIVVAQTKGGVGKTTVAVNVAIERARQGRDVLLVDTDDQQSATEITALRTDRLGSAGYTCIRLSDEAVRSQILRLGDRFQDVIIDAGGRDSVGLRAGLTVADVALIPFRPRSIDLWTLEKMAVLVREARVINPSLRAFAVINCADALGADNADSAEFISENDTVKLLRTTIGQRKAFPNGLSLGLGVSEMKPADLKATAEIQALVAEIFQTEPVAPVIAE